MAHVKVPALPEGLEDFVQALPYNAPMPFYQGGRVLISSSALHRIVKQHLVEEGILEEGCTVVFSWVDMQEGVSLTVSVHEVSA